jgi:hypothetical protein
VSEHEHSVENGVLKRTSASALQLYKACPRKYFYKYVEHRPDHPPSKGMARGTEGHERIKHYLLTGQNVLDPLEQLGIDRELIPMPNPERAKRGFPVSAMALVEHEFRLPTRFGVPLVGAIDLIDPLSPVHWRLTDWKFKKSIENYAATVAGLTDPEHSDGIQMLSYNAVVAAGIGEGPARLAPPLETVTEHVTFQTQGRRDVKPTSTTIAVGAAVDKWQRGVEVLIPKMQATAAETVALSVFGNEKHCHAYGRDCPYIEACYDPMARIKASLKGIDAGSSLKGLKADTIEKGKDNMGIFKKGSAEAEAAKPAFAAPAAVSITAPDQPPTPKPRSIIIEGDTGPIPPSSDALDAAARQMHVAAARRSLEGAPTPETPLSVAEPTAAKKGRKPKSAPTPTTSAPVETVAEYVALEKADRVPAETRTEYVAEVPVARGIRLYIDCQPLGAKTSNLLALVEVLQDQIIVAAKLEVSDLRQSTDGVMGFNKWKAYLASHASEQLATGKIPAGDYVVMGADERVRCVAEAFAAKLPPGSVVVPIGRGL